MAKLESSAKAQTARAWAKPIRHTAMWLALALLVAFGARTKSYTVESDFAYWLGVVGGSAMLIMMLYPLRKRFARLLPFGRLPVWFAGHMVLGIAGPVLILLHCKLSLGSLNAKVAFYSMVIVASSGIAGRFLYAQLHAGLYGRQRSAAELRAQAADALAQAAPMLKPDSAAFAAIARFAALANDTARRGLGAPWQQLSLPWHARSTRRECLNSARAHAGSEQATDQIEKLDDLLSNYLSAALAAARYGAAERLFSLWHVAHLPLVVMLFITAVFHVIAVHQY